MKSRPQKEWCTRFFRENITSGSAVAFERRADAVEYAKAELDHGDYFGESVVTLSFDDDFPTKQEFREGEWFLKPGRSPYARTKRTQPDPPVVKPHLGVTPNPS